MHLTHLWGSPYCTSASHIVEAESSYQDSTDPNFGPIPTEVGGISSRERDMEA